MNPKDESPRTPEAGQDLPPEQPPKVVHCFCIRDNGIPRAALIRTCNTESNPNFGKDYYSCSAGRENGCRFFEPVDPNYKWKEYNRQAKDLPPKRIREERGLDLKIVHDSIDAVKVKLELYGVKQADLEKKLDLLSKRFKIQ